MLLHLLTDFISPDRSHSLGYEYPVRNSAVTADSPVYKLFLGKAVCFVSFARKNASWSLCIVHIATAFQHVTGSYTAYAFGDKLISWHLKRKNQDIAAVFGYLVSHLKRKCRFTERGYSPYAVKPLIQTAVKKSIKSGKPCFHGFCADTLPHSVKKSAEIGTYWVFADILLTLRFVKAFDKSVYMPLPWENTFTENVLICRQSLVSVLKALMGVVYAVRHRKPCKSLWERFRGISACCIVIKGDNKRRKHPFFGFYCP